MAKKAATIQLITTWHIIAANPAVREKKDSTTIGKSSIG
jgi:hypothetical protein